MIKINTKVILCSLFCLGFSLSGFSQKVLEKKAEVEFDKFAYIDAIKLYEKVAKEGHRNADILKKLGDAYYFTGKFTEANKWYFELFEGSYIDKGKGAVGSEYYYRYAETLKATGDYEKSNRVMVRFAELESEDSRAKLFLSNKDYLKKIENKEDNFELTNLIVNSPYSDYGATIYGDQFVYTSARLTPTQPKNMIHKWTNESYTSLFASTINLNGSLENPVLFSPELDSEVNDATAVFTRNRQTVYFTRNNSSSSGKKRKNKENSTLTKIYRASLLGNGKWGKVEELPFNSDNFSTANPALSPDEKWLYFASDRKGGIGQSDIYRVGIFGNGEFSTPENLGSKINTSGRENFPFVSADNYLFFSSDGLPGLGGLDVFVVKINDNGTLGEPVNMGTPINSSYDDFSFYINGVGTDGFISSNRPGGKGGDDIYSFKEKPCLQELTGKVYSKDTKEPIVNAMVVISDAFYKSADTLYTNKEGIYKSKVLSCNEKYRILSQKNGFNTIETVFEISGVSGLKVLDIELEQVIEPIKINDDLFEKLKLKPIYFDYDKAEIRQDAEIELSKIVEVMKLNPDLTIDVRSHTDSRGNPAYNLTLSDRRAKSTRDWIVSHGIEGNRVTYRGFGDTQLLNSCRGGVKCSEDEHAVNRRSEFIVTDL
ncbi:OmpA family protein [Myroides phaeus]|uniref:OmpA family protein n=1 Tax=Myroides phaeus TaxID=702745 RepID=UPI002DBED666|nr:OmpA family protein [Myroides phaeus]MEC4117232.1 OmpA family protein [Myroides phaeus]